MVSNQISVKPSRIARVLGLVAFLLVLASTGLQLMAYLTGRPHIFGLVPLFWVDEEQRYPDFFLRVPLALRSSTSCGYHRAKEKPNGVSRFTLDDPFIRIFAHGSR